MKLIKEEEEAMSWCRACGRYHLFGACPKPEASRRDPAGPLGDPPFPGRSERAIAAKPQKRAENGKQPEISLDSRLAAPSVRLTRGQL